MSGTWQDLRFTCRTLRKNPLYTLVAVMTLALGAGANAAVFSVVNAVLLTPPPFPQPDQLMLIRSTAAGMSDDVPLSYPDYRDLRDRSRSMAALGAWTSYGNLAFTLTGQGEPERLRYAMGTASLFKVLQVQPAAGRLYTEAEDSFGHASRVVLLSHDLWRSRFSANPSIVGQAIVLDGVPYTVIGVLPASFNFVAFPAAPQLWIPLAADPQSPGRHYARGVSYLGVIGRLRNGVTAAAAETDLRDVANQITREMPDHQLRWSLISLHGASTINQREALIVLLAAVGLVLLIACANVANLQLARTLSRRREAQVRLALGASRARLVRASLIDSAVLAVLGGGLGLGVASWSVTALARLPMFGPPSALHPYAVNPEQVHPDGRVLLFLLLVTGATAVLFGLLPALHAGRGDLHQGSGGGLRGSTQRGISRLLVAGEVALALMLLTGAGLLVSSLNRLMHVDPGFRTDDVLTADISLPRSEYGRPAQVTAFFRELVDRTANLPGVLSAGAIDQAPLAGPVDETDFRIDGRAPPPSNSEPVVPFASATPGWFDAMGVRLASGRLFRASDDSAAPRVAVITETMARTYWPGESPIGKRMALSTEALRIGPHGEPSMDWDHAWRTVIGVVRDLHHESLATPAASEVLLPFAQAPTPSATLAIRTKGAPAAMAREITGVVHELDPRQAVSRIAVLDDIVAVSVGEPRFRTTLLELFAGLAALLAVVGVYGVMAYAVSQRTRELGIRSALGADRRRLSLMVLHEGASITALGLAVGAVGAWFGVRLLHRFVIGSGAGDVLLPVAMGISLATAALLASYLPARRAARVDPVEVLRGD